MLGCGVHVYSMEGQHYYSLDSALSSCKNTTMLSIQAFAVSHAIAFHMGTVDN